jgi:Immunoglobulin domain
MEESAQRWRTLIRCDSTESNSLFASTQSECLMKFSSISISFLILAPFTSLLVPPNIDDSLSSSDVIVREGSNITLKCRAHGSPQPTIKWKRDDSSKININKSLSGMLMSRPSSPFPTATLFNFRRVLIEFLCSSLFCLTFGASSL